MAIPPWTVDLLRRGIGEVARKAGDSETLEKIKTQATEILQDLPQAASRGFNAVLRTAEAGKRSVEEWMNDSSDVAVPALNATGILFHQFGSGVPVANSTLEAGAALLRGNCMVNEQLREKLDAQIGQLAPGSGNSIAVANSFPAALTAFSQLVQECPLVIHRSHAVRLPGGVPLPEAFGTLLPVIQEVGSVGGLQEDDFESFESFCAITADAGHQPPELIKFKNADAMQAVVLPVGTVHSKHDLLPSAQVLLDAGVDFVLLPGDGLCGGPACGLIVGKESSLDVIMQSPAWPALRASDAITAMMSSSLESSMSSPESNPIDALVATSEENLNARAERMSIRISGGDEVESCRLTTDPAKVNSDGRWEIPSRQIRVAHQEKSPESWASELRSQNPAIMVGYDDEELIVDLRWIAAADDNALAKAITGDPDQAE